MYPPRFFAFFVCDAEGESHRHWIASIFHFFVGKHNILVGLGVFEGVIHQFQNGPPSFSFFRREVGF